MRGHANGADRGQGEGVERETKWGEREREGEKEGVRRKSEE